MAFRFQLPLQIARAVLVCALPLVAGCSPDSRAGQASAAARSGDRDVLLATTTSTQDTGLLDVLLPAFEGRTGYSVKTLVQGSGAVLALAARGEADVVLAHAPESEREWMSQGYGTERRLVMHNDFVVVGPPNDPANVRLAADAAGALAAIAERGWPFVSRGDGSGTHQREQQLWRRAGLDPRGSRWYVESGSGQGQTLTIADQRNAYALTDRGTWLAFKNKLQLALVFEGDPALLNVYHVMPVNATKFPQVRINAAGGKVFADFLLGAEGQRTIAEFGRELYGQALFSADGGKREEELAG